MAHFVIHPSETRGKANHGWLQSFHTFSFANYFDPERINFGALRVLNDDKVQGGMGFSTHPHQNMEIISIPLEGDLEHKDSMGNVAVIKKGDIQVMSAGTGVFHSEKNKNYAQEVQFLQIWVIPNKENVTPRYDQFTFGELSQNQLHQILSPNQEETGVWIHQEAWFHLGEFEQGVSWEYKVKKEGNGVYFFVLEGSFNIEGNLLNARDGMGVTGDDCCRGIAQTSHARILIMEVPMLS